jgi:hypothetical protein
VHQSRLVDEHRSDSLLAQLLNERDTLVVERIETGDDNVGGGRPRNGARNGSAR